jgi:hypothetical protein
MGPINTWTGVTCDHCPSGLFDESILSGLVQLDGNTSLAGWLVRGVGLGPAKSGPGKSYYNNFGFFIDKLE